MQRGPAAATPEAYVAGLTGWQRDLVVALRTAVRAVAGLEEEVKWGHLVYSSDGPALLIRAEADRVRFGFWRGRALQAIEPRLVPGGKYDMATLTLREGDTLRPAKAKRLAREAVALNRRDGDPRKLPPSKGM